MQPNRFAPKQITGDLQKAELVTQLFSCRPHMLDAYRLEDLRRRFSKVDPKVVEYELIRARQHRREELR